MSCNKIYFATTLTGGGTNALDQIDGSDLVDLDAAIVVTLDKTYIYSLDDDSGAAESSPDVIKPDLNAGTKRWILSEIYEGALDHGSLAGLLDDDHSQYHNNTRGDARYLYKENTDAFTPDADYEPATKKYVDDNAVADHGSLTGLGDDDHIQYTENADTNISGCSWVLDEDNMISDDDTKVPTQQSVKAYVDEHMSPTYCYIKATGQSETTDLHLSDGTNWNTSKALIKTIRVITDSTDWDAWLIQNDNGYSVDDATIPMKQIIDTGGDGDTTIWLDLPYEDEDASNEVHLYFVDNSGSNTFDIIIQGYKLR